MISKYSFCLLVCDRLHSDFLEKMFLAPWPSSSPVLHGQLDVLSTVLRSDAGVLGGEVDLLASSTGNAEHHVLGLELLIGHLFDAHQPCQHRPPRAVTFNSPDPTQGFAQCSVDCSEKRDLQPSHLHTRQSILFHSLDGEM